MLSLAFAFPQNKCALTLVSDACPPTDAAGRGRSACQELRCKTAARCSHAMLSGRQPQPRTARAYVQLARVCIGVWGTPPAVTVPPCLPEGAKGVEASRAADRDVGAADRGVPLDESRHPETRGWFLGTVSADCLAA